MRDLCLLARPKLYFTLRVFLTALILSSGVLNRYNLIFCGAVVINAISIKGDVVRLTFADFHNFDQW